MRKFAFPSQELPCSGSTGIISAFNEESTPRSKTERRYFRFAAAKLRIKSDKLYVSINKDII
jgi:hypothetical protein